jgi:hypothetical protein
VCILRCHEEEILPAHVYVCTHTRHATLKVAKLDYEIKNQRERDALLSHFTWCSFNYFGLWLLTFLHFYVGACKKEKKTA